MRTGPVLVSTLLALAAGAPTAGLPAAGPAADQGPAPTVGFGDYTEVTWVLVPAQVRNGRGFVRGLEADDFRLFVDDRRVAVESFDSGDDAALALVYLQDLSGSMANAGKLDAGRAALRALADRARGVDRFAVATFASGSIEVEVPFTGDLEAVREAAARWRAYGTTSLHDAIAWVPDLESDSRMGRVAAVVVTDGVDNASVLEPGTVRGMVRRAQVPVFVLALRGSLLDSRLGAVTPPPPEDPRRSAVDGWTERYAGVLRRLAAATSGRFFDVRTRGELDAAGRAILEELRSQYTLSFRTSGVGPEDYRRLRVEVARRGVDVSHRAGYVGTAP